jgi:hypothetical protein
MRNPAFPVSIVWAVSSNGESIRGSRSRHQGLAAPVVKHYAGRSDMGTEDVSLGCVVGQGGFPVWPVTHRASRSSESEAQSAQRKNGWLFGGDFVLWDMGSASRPGLAGKICLVSLCSWRFVVLEVGGLSASLLGLCFVSKLGLVESFSLLLDGKILLLLLLLIFSTIFLFSLLFEFRYCDIITHRRVTRIWCSRCADAHIETYTDDNNKVHFEYFSLTPRSNDI